jgi:hypothetical protein
LREHALLYHSSAAACRQAEFGDRGPLADAAHCVLKLCLEDKTCRQHLRRITVYAYDDWATHLTFVK